MGVIDVLDRQHPGSMGEGAWSRDAAERARMQREAAFQALTDLHLARCYRLAAVVLGSGTEAQDAVHDAFVTAWRRFDSLRDPTRLAAWFDRIVVNTCRDHMRHARHLHLRDISDRVEVAAPDAIAPIADALVIRHALERLDPDDRIVLALRFYRDMQVDDIADAMGIRPRAATSRLHRALERLRRILDEERREVA